MIHGFDGTKFALKTMRYNHNLTPRNFDRHRRDMLAAERLTASPWVANIYGFCGNSAVFDFADMGSVANLIWPKSHKKPGFCQLNSFERLNISKQVAHGITDMHEYGTKGIPSISHTDITPDQFVFVDGIYKLNDFNRCRFIAWKPEKKEQCDFLVQKNPGKFRSPEEYMYKNQSEKIDVYSMGNVFYALLTELWPFDELKDKDAQTRIINGERPFIPESISESNDPNQIALLKAMKMCWSQNPSDRATARDVLKYVTKQLSKNARKTIS